MMAQFCHLQSVSGHSQEICRLQIPHTLQGKKGLGQYVEALPTSDVTPIGGSLHLSITDILVPLQLWYDNHLFLIQANIFRLAVRRHLSQLLPASSNARCNMEQCIRDPSLRAQVPTPTPLPRAMRASDPCSGNLHFSIQSVEQQHLRVRLETKLGSPYPFLCRLLAFCCFHGCVVLQDQTPRWAQVDLENERDMKDSWYGKR